VVTRTRREAPTRPGVRPPAKARTSAKKKPKAAPAPARRNGGTRRGPEPFWRVQARDLWAVGLVTLGVLLALALWGPGLGPVGHGVNSGLALVAGWARVLLPVVVAGAGVALLLRRSNLDADADQDRSGVADPVRLAVGSVLGVLAVCGLAQLRHNPPLNHSDALRAAGGYLGAVVGRPLQAGLGTGGAAVVLVAVLVVALLVATGVSLATVGRALRVSATWSGRTAVSLWQGRPFVNLPSEGERAAPNGTAASPAPAEETDAISAGADRADEADEADSADAGKARDFDIDIPIDPEPEPESEPGRDAPSQREPASASARVASTPRAPGGWVLPTLSLLQSSKKMRFDQRQVDAAGEELVRALAAHGVETRLVGSRVGPTVTRYELELGPGVKVARVTSLSKDIAYAMASPDVRILAPIPGKSAIGVEVPNRTRQLVSLRDILESKEALSASHPLEVATGRDIAGRAVMSNLAEMPHILISGATGSGKSSCMNSIITSILMRDDPDQVKLILVDPKRVELGQYEGLPHLLNPVVVDPKKAANALAWTVKEMERRYDLLAENGVRDITGYNQMVGEGLIASPPVSDRRRVRDVAASVLGDDHPAVDAESELPDDPEPPEALPFILVVVDELNDLMMVAARDVEDSIVRIAQMARAVGIHLVIATQRPSVDVITGVIKANIPSRMAFSVSSLADSRVILDQPGAERLVGKGDMLLLTASSNVPRRLQAPWVSEEEVREVVRHWKGQGGQTEAIVAIEGVDDGPSDPGAVDADDDELLAQARDLVVRSQLGSTSMLQRKLRVGFARAGRLMDLLERSGVVGPSEGSKARAVLMTPEELDALSRR
jgi:DNA segregation ATPase FtsK/SpoIIIE, S-DNA-T family